MITITFTEWPKYQTGAYSNQGAVGDVNIISIGSNAVNYTLLLELYNYTGNKTHMERIGEKLRAIFSLPVACFTGCNQKSDYTKIRKEYPEFQLPEEAKKKMDDVSLMSINRGLTIRGRGNNTLQALCRSQGMFLRKPANVRVGTVWDSKGTLSQEAQKYSQLDTEAPLILHSLYSGIPDMTLRATLEELPVDTVVDIMPSLGSSIHPIAQGFVKQTAGSMWCGNKIKIGKGQVLVQVTKVYNGRGVIHYPSTSTHHKKCACGRGSHSGKIGESCNFYLLSQLGPPPYELLELKSRLRLYNEAYKYPDEVDVDVAAAPNIEVGPSDEVLDPKNNDGTSGSEQLLDDDDDEDETNDDDDVELAMNPEILEALGAMEDEAPRLADDDDDKSVEYEEVEGTEAQKRLASSEDFDEILKRIIEEADKLAAEDNIKEPDEERDIPIEELPKSGTWRTVLADIFHLMDRAKLPMHHDYKALFFRALRAAMFIMNKRDVDQVKTVLQKKGISWNKTLAFNFDYIAKRVRRTVPPADVLYNRLLAVYNFFKDKKDTETGDVLFNTRARKRFELMLELVKKGYASDPPGLELYVPKTDKYGRVMVDRDGLQLYRSLRGTSNLESLHQYLTTSFGHTMSGPWYSDSLLTVLRHFFNWRMSRKNRPNFPNINHYDGLLLDRINRLYELIFGYKKYRSWSEFNENLPIKSAFGIIEVNKKLTASVVHSDEDVAILSKNRTLTYLAERQQSPIPFMPIRGENEKKLIHKKLNEVLVSGQSFANQRVYNKIADDWNTHHISVKDKTFAKMPSHIFKYVKGWKKNQNRRDAEVGSGANRIFDAVEYVPDPVNNLQTFQPLEISGTNETATPTIPTDSLGGDTQDPTEIAVQETPAMCVACPVDEGEDGEVQEQPKKKKKFTRRSKRCQGWGDRPCGDPDNCTGAQFKRNCVNRTGGNPDLMEKRTITKSYERTCQECFSKGCPGSQNRGNCMYK